MNYSNYGKDKIKSLDIWGHNGINTSNEISIHLKLGDSYCIEREYIKCSYSFKNKDDETIFRQEISSLLEKNSSIHRTYISGYYLALTLFLLVIGKFFFESVFDCFKEGAFGLGVFMLLFVIALAFGLSALFNIVWKKAFPQVVFAWGEELKHEDKMCHLRSNVIWGIIIAAIASIILSFII